MRAAFQQKLFDIKYHIPGEIKTFKKREKDIAGRAEGSRGRGEVNFTTEKHL